MSKQQQSKKFQKHTSATKQAGVREVSKTNLLKQDSTKIELKTWIIAAAILVITYFVFSPSLNCQFTNWDDPTYVTKNILITNPAKTTTKQLFSEYVSSNYHPLTMLTLKWDYEAAKLNPKRYHAVNLALHVFNTFLVFLFIFFLSGRKTNVAGIVSLLFGIHPLHVESVTWIAERKDVLYTFFFMAALIMYYFYIKATKNKALLYVLILVLFVLSCFSKAMAVALPLAMLTVDYYLNRDLKNKWLWIEKIPFFIIAFIFGMIAIKAQQADAIAKFETFTLFQRIMFGTYGMINSLFLFFFPNKLSTFYPYPFLVDGHLPYFFYFAPFIALLIFFICYKLIKISKVYWFGILFFFATIMLVLQFMSVGKAIMADRYAYIPYISIAFIVASEYDRILHSTKKTLSWLKPIMLPGILVFAGILSYISYYRTMTWTTNYTLWTDVMKKYKYVDVAYKNRGNYFVDEAMALRDKGSKDDAAIQKYYDLALADYMNYITINQSDPKIYTNRGNIYGIKGKFDLALADYSKSISLDTVSNIEAYLNRAITYSMMKQYDKVFEDYAHAERIDPNTIGIYQNRAYVYMELGMYDKAIEDYTKYIDHAPDEHLTYFFRALTYYKAGKFKECVADNTRGIEINDSNPGFYQNRSLGYKELKMYTNALQDALKAKSMGANVEDSYIKELTALAK